MTDEPMEPLGKVIFSEVNYALVRGRADPGPSFINPGREAKIEFCENGITIAYEQGLIFKKVISFHFMLDQIRDIRIIHALGLPRFVSLYTSKDIVLDLLSAAYYLATDIWVLILQFYWRRGAEESVIRGIMNRLGQNIQCPDDFKWKRNLDEFDGKVIFKAGQPPQLINSDSSDDRFITAGIGEEISHQQVIKSHANQPNSLHTFPSSQNVAAKLAAETSIKVSEELEKLENLIGLANVKKRIKEIAAIQLSNRERVLQGLPSVGVSNHMIFSGNPGTGKTTVARIFSTILFRLGALSKGQFIETDRSGLVSGYLGQTALKTKRVLDEARGGVLFIDEAYSLVNKAEDLYGAEAIETILKYMEDYRDEITIIAAGYTEQMRTFVDSNPGLRSRFSTTIVFNDYTPDELYMIFMQTARASGFVIPEETGVEAFRCILSLVNTKQPSFGNAREVRNMFESAITNQALRLMNSPEKSKSKLVTLLPCDIPKDR